MKKKEIKHFQTIEQPGGLVAFTISPLKTNGRVQLQQRDYRGRLYGITIGGEHLKRTIEILQDRLHDWELEQIESSHTAAAQNREG